MNEKDNKAETINHASWHCIHVLGAKQALQ